MSRKQISVKPCCKVCKDAGKSEAMFSSHFVKDRTGKVICPLLLSQECRYCFKLGHTVKFCQALNNGEPGEKGARRIRDQVYESSVLQKYEEQKYEEQKYEETKETKETKEKPETKEKADYEFPPLSPNVTLRPHQMSWTKECVRPLSAAKGVPIVNTQRSWVKITSTILNPKETLPALQPQPTINSWITEDKKEKVAVPFISVQQYEKNLRFSAGLKNGTIKWSDVESDDDDDEQYIYI